MLHEALDCVKIFENGNFTDHMESHMFSNWQSYTNKIHRESRASVWYDKIEEICFGEELTFYHDPNEFSFFSYGEDFFSNQLWGLKHVEEKFGVVLGKEIIKTNDFIIQDNKNLEKFKDKIILAVGAGPSAIDYDWEDVEHDYVWSCTKFYLNEKVLDKNLGLVTIGGNVNLEDEGLLSALEKTGAMCGFECGVSPFKNLMELEKFKNRFGDKVFYFHPRYFSKLGAMPRLICLAAFLGAREIKFIGFDGDPVGQKHSFEKNKVHNEIWRNDKSTNIYRRQMILFWDYMLQFNVKYVNLGEGHSNNLTTHILKR